MGLFGPTQREMTDAVADGINQAIRTGSHIIYKLKIGKVPIKGQYLYMMPTEVSVMPYDPSSAITAPAPIKIENKTGYYIIYDVIEESHSTRFNPFTDIKTDNIVSERNIARYNSYDGWDNNKIQKIIEWAYKNGYYPTYKENVDMVLDGSL